MDLEKKLHKERFLAKHGFDTAENEPSKVRCTGFTRYDDDDWISYAQPRL